MKIYFINSLRHSEWQRAMFPMLPKKMHIVSPNLANLDFDATLSLMKRYQMHYNHGTRFKCEFTNSEQIDLIVRCRDLIEKYSNSNFVIDTETWKHFRLTNNGERFLKMKLIAGQNA